MPGRVEIPLIVLDPDTGAYVEDAEITVTKRPSGAADVYATATGGSPITQPFLSDAQGRVTGWVERGAYDVTIAITGNPDTIEPFDAVPGQDGGIDTTALVDDAVTQAKVAAGAIGVDELGDDAVDTAAIQDLAVTAAKLADDTITTAKLVNDSVNATKLADDTTTDSNRAVTTNHIRDDAVTAAKLKDDPSTDANRAVTTDHIRDRSVTSRKVRLTEDSLAFAGNITLDGTWQRFASSLSVTPSVNSLALISFTTQIVLRNTSNYTLNGSVTASVTLNGTPTGPQFVTSIAMKSDSSGPNPSYTYPLSGSLILPLNGSVTYALNLAATTSMSNGTSLMQSGVNKWATIGYILVAS